MPTSDDLRQRAAKLRAEADEHERQAAINRGDAARLEEIADRNDREAAEALERLGLPSGTENATMGAMSASAISPIDSNFRRHRGQAPKGGGPFDAASAATGLSLRQIAIRMKISPNTLKSINRRAAEGKYELSPVLDSALSKLVASVEKEKKKK